MPMGAPSRAHASYRENRIGVASPAKQAQCQMRNDLILRRIWLQLRVSCKFFRQPHDADLGSTTSRRAACRSIKQSEVTALLAAPQARR